MRRYVAEVRRAPDLEHRLDNRLAVLILEPLARDNDHAVLFLDQLLNVPQVLRLVKRPFRQIDQIRAVHARLPRQRAGRGDPARVAPARLDHHHVNRQAANVRRHLRDALGDIPRRAAEPRRVIRHGDIVVHRLGDAHHADVRARQHPAELSAGVHRAVSAVHQHVFCAQLHAFFRQQAVFRFLQRVAGCADGAAGRAFQQRELLLGDIGQVAHLPAHEAARAADGRQNPVNVRLFLRLTDRPRQRCVDHGRRPAAMDQDQIALHRFPFLSVSFCFYQQLSKKQILYKTRARNARPYGYGATYCLDGK